MREQAQGDCDAGQGGEAHERRTEVDGFRQKAAEQRADRQRAGVHPVEAAEHPASLVEAHEVDTGDLTSERPEAVPYAHEERGQEDGPEPRCDRADECAEQDEPRPADEHLPGAEAVDQHACARDSEEAPEGVGGDDLRSGAGAHAEVVDEHRRDRQHHRPTGAGNERSGVQVAEAAGRGTAEQCRR